MQEIQHLEDESVEIQVVERFSKETPVWASESEEHQSQGNKMVVNGVTLAVKKNTFLFPVQVGHAGIEERADVGLMVVQSCACLKKVIEPI